jgi:hypothetical protein
MSMLVIFQARFSARAKASSVIVLPSSFWLKKRSFSRHFFARKSILGEVRSLYCQSGQADDGHNLTSFG